MPCSHFPFTLQFVNANLANRGSDEVECPGRQTYNLCLLLQYKIVCCHDLAANQVF